MFLLRPNATQYFHPTQGQNLRIRILEQKENVR